MWKEADPEQETTENFFEDGDRVYIQGLESRRIRQEQSMVVSYSEGVVVDAVT